MSIHSRIINQAKRLAVFKINKTSRKGRETATLVFKAANSAAAAGAGAEETPREERGDRCRQDGR